MATSSKSSEKPVKPKAVAAAKKPASPAKTTAKSAVTKAAAPAKSTATKPVVSAAKTTGTKKPAIAKKSASPLSAGQRRFYVEVAAYYIAERRGFQGGNALDDWAAAEAEVDRLLRDGILNA
jgi:hypothetical protein